MPAENQPTKKISIDEVAKALGVSKTTVSRALSGKGRISEATRGRVRDYIAQAGAEPAVRAQPTARETHNLTMVIPSDFVHLDLPFLRKCMGGICTAAAQRGYDLLLCYVSGADTNQLERQLDCHKMDGVILSRTIQNDPCVELLRRHKMPFVAIGRTEDPAIPQVDNDQAAASQEMTRLLLQLGLRRIALLTGSPSYYVNQDRAKGYFDALAELGIQPDPALVRTGIESDAQRIDALDAVLERRPDCILCGDDRLAFDVSLELQARRIRVPDDIRLASLYDSELTAGLNPAISAVHFDAVALGGAACRMLLDLMAGKAAARPLVMGHQVVLRDSTKSLPRR
ncbi:MAG TPA: LacI family transcriptional regulator [Candidatus Gemmiger faecigallinarum]|nr:LacI family transcriptional regulator [Candidatus Gemmiger faecigallinarum]